MAKVDAIVIKSRGKYEVRCARCGKMLMICKFSDEYAENLNKSVDNSSRNVIIVTRCTRNDCKTDNLLFLS